MNNSSSDGHELLVNKGRYSTSSEASRTGRRRLKKEVDPERQQSSSNNNNNKASSVSTTLKLYEDPWKIKKTLTESDLGILSRLLLAVDLVKKHILPMLSAEHARAAETHEATPVRVWDMDTKLIHQLLLKRWSSSKSYVIGKWSQDFVRRELKKGDEIGFYWNPYTSLFNFCVLKRANRS